MEKMKKTDEKIRKKSEVIDIENREKTYPISLEEYVLQRLVKEDSKSNDLLPQLLEQYKESANQRATIEKMKDELEKSKDDKTDLMVELKDHVISEKNKQDLIDHQKSVMSEFHIFASYRNRGDPQYERDLLHNNAGNCDTIDLWVYIPNGRINQECPINIASYGFGYENEKEKDLIEKLGFELPRKYE